MIVDAYITEQHPYVLIFYNDDEISLQEHEIIRLLNQDDINNFLIKRDTQKYNL